MFALLKTKSKAVKGMRAVFVDSTKATFVPNAVTVRAQCKLFAESSLAKSQVPLIMAASPIRNRDVEKLGEDGARHYLEAWLAERGMPFDPNGLHQFAGRDTFNMVYLHPPAPDATSAIIIEAKGGGGSLGTRMSKTTYDQVKQGTLEYMDTIIALMAGNNARDRQKQKQKKDVGVALATLRDKLEGGVIYMAVRTRYDKPSKTAKEPTLISIVTSETK